MAIAHTMYGAFWEIAPVLAWTVEAVLPGKTTRTHALRQRAHAPGSKPRHTKSLIGHALRGIQNDSH